MSIYRVELMRKYPPDEFGGFDIAIYKPSGYIVEVSEFASVVHTDCLTMENGVVKKQDVIVLGHVYAKKVP